jgi:hypothetical protein
MNSYEEWLNETEQILFKDFGLYIEDLEEELLFYFQLNYSPEQMVNIISKQLNQLLLETVEYWLF